MRHRLATSTLFDRYFFHKIFCKFHAFNPEFCFVLGSSRIMSFFNGNMAPAVANQTTTASTHQQQTQSNNLRRLYNNQYHQNAPLFASNQNAFYAPPNVASTSYIQQPPPPPQLQQHQHAHQQHLGFANGGLDGARSHLLAGGGGYTAPWRHLHELRISSRLPVSVERHAAARRSLYVKSQFAGGAVLRLLSLRAA